MQKKLGFMGAGNMVEAIVRSAISANVLTPDQIQVSAKTDAKADLYASLGVAFTTDNRHLIATSEQVVIGVKPQIYPLVVDDLNAALTDDHILISIMAGLTAEGINKPLNKPARIVRTMPNTPIMLNMGMAGIAMGPHAKPGDDALAYQVLTAGNNQAVRIEEHELDALTAVSGSGPAYVFLFAEAMEQAARDMGLGEHAELLASQTLLGAATLLSQSPDTAAELRRKVTSPNGTTQAGVEGMQAHKMPEAVMAGIFAARDRSLALAGLKK